MQCTEREKVYDFAITNHHLENLPNNLQELELANSDKIYIVDKKNQRFS